MKIRKDIYGNEINEGDIIAFPHIKEDGYEDKILNGYYVTKVFYDKKEDRLVDDNGIGFRLAYGIVKLNR